jgi:signal transduction histidine kinase
MSDPTSSAELLRIDIRDASGVFTARQIGRAVAAEVALDEQDQIRVATALSEIGRDLLIGAAPATVVFGLSTAPPALVVEIHHGGATSPADGVALASRLMDSVTEEPTLLRMTKRLAATARTPTAGRVSTIRDRLAALVPSSALDELRRQNRELVEALEDAESRREELGRLNAELEETNHGVMALYTQLSDELEETNRGVVALYADLDDKSARLREAGEAKNRFWANISHELRTPLNSAIGLTRLLRESDAGPLNEEQHRQVELIENAGQTLLALVNELLDIAKAESGRLELNIEPVDLAALLARMHALLRPMTEDRPVALVVDTSNVPSTILTDEVVLTRILANLLSNGLKFTERGEVRLDVRPVGDRLDLVVTDTGIGIADDQQEQVFEEFYQVPGEVQARAGSGTGLGLPYARRLTELLGGELSLSSRPGEGTSVVMSVPLVSPGEPRLGTVLIVDDDASYRRVLCTFLDGWATRIIEAADGAEALSLLAEEPDLILLDLRMPEIDGYRLLQLLAADGRHRHIPAIVVSSTEAGSDERLQHAREFLDKSRLTAGRLVYSLDRVRRRPE